MNEPIGFRVLWDEKTVIATTRLTVSVSHRNWLHVRNITPYSLYRYPVKNEITGEWFEADIEPSEEWRHD